MAMHYTESRVHFVNLTPHVVRLNDGTEYQPSGTVARVSTHYAPVNSDGISQIRFGEVTGLPPVVETSVDTDDNGDTLLEATYFIVSALVAQASKRSDLVSPATGHPDCVRDNGQVISVPFFVCTPN